MRARSPAGAARSSTVCTALAKPSTSQVAASAPEPGATTAAAPPTRVLTTGTPAVCASIRLTGVPSLSDVSTTTSLAKQTAGTSR